MVGHHMFNGVLAARAASPWLRVLERSVACSIVVVSFRQIFGLRKAYTLSTLWVKIFYFTYTIELYTELTKN
jgi:hypothetical protein